MNFQYYKLKNHKIGNIKTIQNVLTIGGKSVFLDSKYLPVIEAAENGDITAIAELAEAFRDGRQGLKRNYFLARHYTNLMQENAKRNLILAEEAYRNSGFLELSFGNFENAIEDYKKAIYIMHQHLPFEEWEFRTYKNMAKAVESLLKEEDKKP
ncbi:MAG: hypothetical protein GYB31_01805 [Bacteroidetes bacterium]|nr:hypothetical protein [Bacteroidota bacterium]